MADPEEITIRHWWFVESVGNWRTYPDFLILNCAPHNGDGSVHYLDMTISPSKAYGDKAEVQYSWQRRLNSVKKGLKLNKFPHSASCLAETCLYNVITSQCHRFQRAFQNAVLPTFSYIVICKIYSQRLWSTNLSLSCYYIDLLWNWQQRQYDWNPSMNKIFHESTQNPNSDDKNWFIADDSSYYNSLV